MDNGFQKVEKEKKGFKKVKSAKERNIYVHKVACPECGSMETSAHNPGTGVIGIGLAIFVSSLTAFGCCLWIPILGWALLIPFGIGIMIGLGILLLGSILTLFIKTLTFKCNDCGSMQKINSKEYKEMANKII